MSKENIPRGADFTYGDWVYNKTDPRHIGKSAIPKSHRQGFADVTWEETGLKSEDVPVGELKLSRRHFFNITISEFQRERITTALMAFDAVAKPGWSKENGTGDEGMGGSDTEHAEMEALVKMFRELPEDDAKMDPGCLHGFCL